MEQYRITSKNCVVKLSKMIYDTMLRRPSPAVFSSKSNLNTEYAKSFQVTIICELINRGFTVINILFVCC